MNSGVLAGVLRTAYQIAHPNTEVPKKVDADGEYAAVRIPYTVPRTPPRTPLPRTPCSRSADPARPSLPGQLRL